MKWKKLQKTWKSRKSRSELNVVFPPPKSMKKKTAMGSKCFFSKSLSQVIHHSALSKELSTTWGEQWHCDCKDSGALDWKISAICSAESRGPNGRAVWRKKAGRAAAQLTDENKKKKKNLIPLTWVSGELHREPRRNENLQIEIYQNNLTDALLWREELPGRLTGNERRVSFKIRCCRASRWSCITVRSLDYTSSWTVFPPLSSKHLVEKKIKIKT